MIVAVCVAPTLARAEFPMGGGNPQRTGFVDLPGPMTEPEVLWERSLGVAGSSNTQPLVDEAGNIYVTGAPEGGLDRPKTQDPRGALVSLDPQGKERWRYEYSWDPKKPGYGGSASLLSIPVLAPENRIVMGFRQGWYRCWDRNTGHLIWERDLSPDLSPITSASNVDREGNLYIYCRDIPVLHKIDSKTGNLLWAHRFVDGAIGNASSSSLSHDQKTIYHGRTSRGIAYLYAINADDGRFKWAWSPEVSKGHSFAWCIPVVGKDGTVYIQDEEFAHLYAVTDLGKLHARKWSFKREGKGAPRLPAVDEDTIYSSFNEPSPAGLEPVVFALGHDGKKKWEIYLGQGRGISGMLVNNDMLYFGLSGTGKIYGVDKRMGDVRWVKKVGRNHGGFSEGLALGPGGVLYAGTDGTPAHPDEATVVALKAE